MPQAVMVLRGMQVDQSFVPTEGEIDEYADWLGMDKETEADLRWIAKEALQALLPGPWQPCEAGDEVFYFNSETGQSVWEHPCDQHYMALLAAERRKKGQNAQKVPTKPKEEASKANDNPKEEASKANENPKVEDEDSEESSDSDSGLDPTKPRRVNRLAREPYPSDQGGGVNGKPKEEDSEESSDSDWGLDPTKPRRVNRLARERCPSDQGDGVGADFGIVTSSYSMEVAALRCQHSEVLRLLSQAHAKELATLRADHKKVVDEARRQTQEAERRLARARQAEDAQFHVELSRYRRQKQQEMEKHKEAADRRAAEQLECLRRGTGLHRGQEREVGDESQLPPNWQWTTQEGGHHAWQHQWNKAPITQRARTEDQQRPGWLEKGRSKYTAEQRAKIQSGDGQAWAGTASEAATVDLETRQAAQEEDGWHVLPTVADVTVQEDLSGTWNWVA